MSIRVSVIFMAVLLLAASCKKEEHVNQPPSKPKLLTPAKGAVVAPEEITFTWEQSTDAEGEAMEYDLAVSSDSVDWKYFTAGAASSKTIANKSGSGSYYAFEIGKKYYWRLAVDSKDADGQITGTTESDVVRFYTIPSGVTNLSKTSGNGFVNLAWTDPAGLTKVEVTFSPAVSGIAQPIEVNPGVGKVELQGMQNETVYSFFVKAFNSLGHNSKADTIKALPLSPTLVHDADFNIYTTVQIGTQTWLRENLRATKWQDGTEMKDNYGKYYRIGSKSDIYGLYYSANAVTGGGYQDKNPCPCGYHVPTDEDFKTLERYLGVPEEDINNTFHSFIRGEDEGAGNLLKSTTGWNDYNGVSGNGTDLYGFNLKPAGYIFSGKEELVGDEAFMRGSSEYAGFLVVRKFCSSNKGIIRAQALFYEAIRCVKD